MHRTYFMALDLHRKQIIQEIIEEIDGNEETVVVDKEPLGEERTEIDVVNPGVQKLIQNIIEF